MGRPASGDDDAALERVVRRGVDREAVAPHLSHDARDGGRVVGARLTTSGLRCRWAPWGTPWGTKSPPTAPLCPVSGGSTSGTGQPFRRAAGATGTPASALSLALGGGGEIDLLDDVTAVNGFETAPFNRSGTPPSGGDDRDAGLAKRKPAQRATELAQVRHLLRGLDPIGHDLHLERAPSACWPRPRRGPDRRRRRARPRGPARPLDCRHGKRAGRAPYAGGRRP